ncbi:Myosin-15 [Morella rubra]|uniref:Myosin-15 n=1 Tax=Morella rubra TaxID=262757 RepID=A0A6A1VGC6_9ROSI|nr:Myosin-15 [Morella rubra]
MTVFCATAEVHGAITTVGGSASSTCSCSRVAKLFIYFLVIFFRLLDNGEVTIRSSMKNAIGLLILKKKQLGCVLITEHENPLVGLIILAVLAALAIVIVVIVACWIKRCLRRRRRRSNNSQVRRRIDANLDDFHADEILKSYGSIAPRRYTCAKVKKLTKSFKLCELLLCTLFDWTIVFRLIVFSTVSLDLPSHRFPFSTEDIDIAIPAIDPSDTEVPTFLSEYPCAQFLDQHQK